MLKNLVDPQDLAKEEDFADVKDDISAQCKKFGNLLSLEIIRPEGQQDQRPQVGKVFLEYESIEEAKEAKKVQLDHDIA